MFMPFDTFSETSLTIERESCFEAGSCGDSLPQNITYSRDKHAANIKALRHTSALFADDEPKRRLHGKVNARLEQEQKWVKHYEHCIAEHKKGMIVAKLKRDVNEAKKEAIKNRAIFEAKVEETRKQCRIQFRAEFEAELKAKKENRKEAKKPKKGFWSGLYDWFAGKEEEPQKELPKPAPMVTKTAVPTGAMSARQKREFYMMRAAEKKSAATVAG